MPAAQIMDTGLRGFLKWARQEYPPDIYQQIAAQVQQAIPQGFSGYMLGGWRKIARAQGFADASGTATVDTADAANSTPASPSWADSISQIIGTLTAARLDIQQQQQQQQIINTQLQQAQNGAKPFPISLSSAGITFGSDASSIGTGAVLGGLAFLAYLVFRRKR